MEHEETLSQIDFWGNRMEQDPPLSLSRKELRLGKYTRWAADLTPDEMLALLWVVGEFGCRSSPDDPEYPPLGLFSLARKEVGRQMLVGFVHGSPLTLEQAREQVRRAVMRIRSPQSRASGSSSADDQSPEA